MKKMPQSSKSFQTKWTLCKLVAEKETNYGLDDCNE